MPTPTIVLPEDLPCSGQLICDETSPLDLLPYTGREICREILDEVTCNVDLYRSLVDPTNRYSIQTSIYILYYRTPEMLADLVDFAAFGIDMGEQINFWRIAPIVGPLLAATTQYNRDLNGDYSPMQRGARTVLVAAEGSVISAIAAYGAGVSGLAGIETGPYDLVIVGGSYAAGSFIMLQGADQWNENTGFPVIQAYIP